MYNLQEYNIKYNFHITNIVTSFKPMLLIDVFVLGDTTFEFRNV